MLFMAASLSAQDLVNFKLQPDGTFKAEDGKSFVVIEYDGKNQQELYNMVKANVLTLYDNPQEVLNEIEPTNITIRGISDVLWSGIKLIGGIQEYRAKYNYVFHFKDGRIKVDAPLIDSQLVVSGMGVTFSKTFVSFIDDWFDKKGGIKKKKEKDVSSVESIFNIPINYLLGNMKENIKEEEEDW